MASEKPLCLRGNVQGVCTDRFPLVVRSGIMWKYGCPKSPIWSSPCSARVTSGDDEEYGHNKECRAIEVIGQDWSSEVVAFFLKDWGTELPYINGPSLPRNEGRVLGERRVVGLPLFTVRSPHSNKAFLSPWKGCDKKGVVREKKSKKEA